MNCLHLLNLKGPLMAVEISSIHLFGHAAVQIFVVDFDFALGCQLGKKKKKALMMQQELYLMMKKQAARRLLDSLLA